MRDLPPSGRTSKNAGKPVTRENDGYSRSAKGVVRGLNYQIRHPQGKLVRVTQGEVFDVAVDLRRSSPHFGQWVGVVHDSRVGVKWPIEGDPQLAAKDAAAETLQQAEVFA